MIDVPLPELTPAQMIARACEMVPALRERQAECEALGRIPQETNDEFVSAGFYRILQPRRFGGYEFDLGTFARVMMEVSRGCPSSGWVLALTAGHAIMLSAFFQEEAQHEQNGVDSEIRRRRARIPGSESHTAASDCPSRRGWLHPERRVGLCVRLRHRNARDRRHWRDPGR